MAGNEGLKILWISHLIPYPPRGGVLMRSNYLATELARQHQVDLLALNQSQLLQSYYPTVADGMAAARQALAGSFRKLEFFELSAGQTLADKRALALRSLFSELPYSVGWLRNEALAQAIEERVRQEDYDLLHFDTVGLAQYRPSTLDVPAVLDHHNIESHMMLRRAEKEWNPLKKAYFYQEGFRLRHYEMKVLPLFQGHITCSSLDTERLVDLHQNLSVKAIPNSVRIDPAFQPANNNNTSNNRLLFIGGLDWYPNRDAVLHFCKVIWPRIIEQRPEIELHIVGKNPGTEIRRFADADPRIRVHGFVEDISAMYRHSDVFICPIRDGGGTKLKILDAMAHYMPVVGYPEACEGIDVVYGENAMVVKTPQAFADAVLQLLASPQVARRIGERARRLVEEKYEAVRVGEDLCRYYREVAQAA